MMGRQEAGQAPLFYASNLEDHVPASHLLRGIDQFLDLSEVHRHLAPHYNHTGRPSVDPALLIRMLIVGHCCGIRSERRLCEEAHLNLAYRWFCRLGLEDAVPDHSTFSKNRHGRFRDNDTLRFVFEKVLERCLAEGLVGGEGFAIDASVIKADANRQRGVPGNEASWDRVSSLTRPVREYLEALDTAAEQRKPPKNVSLTDPAAQWPPCTRWSGVLRLFDQLPDRYEGRRYCPGDPAVQRSSTRTEFFNGIGHKRILVEDWSCRRLNVTQRPSLGP
jgi:transposase